MTKGEWVRIYEEEYINNKDSLSKIADRYNVGSTTVHRNFTKLGLKCRNDSEKSRKYVCNYNYFDNIDSPEKAYWLGFIYADGYVTKNKFGIALKDSDCKHLEKLKLCMSSTHKICFYENNGFGGEYKKTRYCRLIITNDHLVDSLVKNGVLYNKSTILKPPNINDALIRHFIRGYMDGDGSICKNNCRSPFFAVSWIGTYEVLKWIGDYFVKCNIVDHVNIHKEHNSDKVFCLRFGGNIISEKILDHLYDGVDNIFLDRKYDKYMELKQLISSRSN